MAGNDNSELVGWGIFCGVAGGIVIIITITVLIAQGHLHPIRVFRHSICNNQRDHDWYSHDDEPPVNLNWTQESQINAQRRANPLSSTALPIPARPRQRPNHNILPFSFFQRPDDPSVPDEVKLNYNLKYPAPSYQKDAPDIDLDPEVVPSIIFHADKLPGVMRTYGIEVDKREEDSVGKNSLFVPTHDHVNTIGHCQIPDHLKLQTTPQPLGANHLKGLWMFKH